MNDLLKRIASYFANEYHGDDETAPKMELSVEDLRSIVAMNVDRCRAEAELREAKNESEKIKDPIRQDMCTCPRCETYNEIIKKRRKTVATDVVYCWHCGQAISVKQVN